jgi:glycosyltransferase 2 family protein
MSWLAAVVGRRGLILLGFAISLGAIWIVAGGTDLARTGAEVARADPRYLAAAIGVVGVQTLIRAIRWQVLLPVGPAGRTGLNRIVPVVLVGYLANAALPARLGEAVRSVVLAGREGLSVTLTLGSALLERILDTLVVAILGATAGLLIGVDAWVLQAALVGLVISLFALAALVVAPRFLARIGIDSLRDLIGVVQGVVRGATAQRPGALAIAVGATLVAWLLDASTYWLVAASLGLELTPAGAMLVSAVAVLSTAIPSAPGYVGTFELAASAAAAALGIGRETGLAFAVVAHVVAVVPISIAGALAASVMGVRLGRPVAAR